MFEFHSADNPAGTRYFSPYMKQFRKQIQEVTLCVIRFMKKN